MICYLSSSLSLSVTLIPHLFSEQILSGPQTPCRRLRNLRALWSFICVKSRQVELSHNCEKSKSEEATQSILPLLSRATKSSCICDISGTANLKSLLFIYKWTKSSVMQTWVDRAGKSLNIFVFRIKSSRILCSNGPEKSKWPGQRQSSNSYLPEFCTPYDDFETSTSVDLSKEETRKVLSADTGVFVSLQSKTACVRTTEGTEKIP